MLYVHIRAHVKAQLAAQPAAATTRLPYSEYKHINKDWKLIKYDKPYLPFGNNRASHRIVRKRKRCEHAVCNDDERRRWPSTLDVVVVVDGGVWLPCWHALFRRSMKEEYGHACARACTQTHKLLVLLTYARVHIYFSRTTHTNGDQVKYRAWACRLALRLSLCIIKILTTTTTTTATAAAAATVMAAQVQSGKRDDDTTHCRSHVDACIWCSRVVW